MVDYKQVLRLHAEGVSQRGIADVLSCSRNTVASVSTAASAAGIGFDHVAGFGSEEVRHLVLPDPPKTVSDRVAPDFEHVHREMARASVTLLLSWNEYVARCRAEGHHRQDHHERSRHRVDLRRSTRKHVGELG